MHIQILTVVDPCYSLAAIYWCSAQMELKWTLGYLSYIIPEPTARSAVRRGLRIPLGYLQPGNANIAKCKVIVPVMDGFRRYAHARVITDFKNMADYMKGEHWLKTSEKAKTKTRTTATRLQETPEKR